jgi:hypothetical protein
VRGVVAASYQTGGERFGIFVEGTAWSGDLAGNCSSQISPPSVPAPGRRDNSASIELPKTVYLVARRSPDPHRT